MGRNIAWGPIGRPARQPSCWPACTACNVAIRARERWWRRTLSAARCVAVRCACPCRHRRLPADTRFLGYTRTAFDLAAQQGAAIGTEG